MGLIDTPENPVPEGVTDGFVQTRDGCRLRYARWVPHVHAGRGTVVLLHGRAEFIEKYFEVVDDLLARGFTVVTFDWRGQGGSDRSLPDPERGYVRSFDEYVRDLETVLKEVCLADCPPPFYLLAHSAGGAVVLAAASRLRTQINRAVLVSPFVGLRKYPVRETTIFRLARLFKWCGLGGRFVPGGHGVRPLSFEGNRLTSDRKRFDRLTSVLAKAPELAVGSATICWLHAAAKVLTRFHHPAFGPSVSLPILMVTAGADGIVSTRASEELATRMKSVGYLEIPGAQHELLLEADVFREQFWAAFDAFVPGQG